MKVNFDAVIVDLEGHPVRDGDKDVTLGHISCQALLAVYKDEEVPGIDKVFRFRLAERAVAGGEQNLSAEDVSLIKKLVGKCYAPLIVGRAFDLIEGKGP